ncbi:MAG TPA: hypothetical protein VIO38_11695 [Rariglobus sp.]
MNGVSTFGEGPTPARAAWRLLEQLHAVTYFADECHEEYRISGLRGGLMSYVAGRTAAMGPVGPDEAAAALFSFHPALIARVVPRAWAFSSAPEILEARLRGVDRVLRRLLGDRTCASPDLARIAAIVEDVMVLADTDGRPMFTAHRDLPVPDEPHLRLWRAATLVREHRGDGHAAALRSNDVSICEAHMIVVAVTTVGRDWLRFRGYSDKDCADAEDRLRARGWLDGHALTPRGHLAWCRIENRTDALSAVGWDYLPSDQMTSLTAALVDLVTPIRRAAVLPHPYPPVG